MPFPVKHQVRDSSTKTVGDHGLTPNAPALSISAGVRFGVKCDQGGSNRSAPPASRESLAGEREVVPGPIAERGSIAGNLRSLIWGVSACPLSSPAFRAGLVTAFEKRGDFLEGSIRALGSRFRLVPSAVVLYSSMSQP